MFGALGDLGSAIMTPLYYAVSAVLLAWHWAFTSLPISSGWAWVLSIIGLTITIRAALIPLFVKQIKSSRNMQLLQPQIKELQKKYGHDRERLTQEQMKLWKDTGTNPFASCLPLLLQMPIFFALFRVIDHASKYNPKKDGSFHKGFLTSSDAISLSNAKFLGARIAETFVNSTATETKILTLALVLIMCATQFTTQRQLMTKNMPADAMSGQYAQQQKMLLYILPVVFAVGGVAFPQTAVDHSPAPSLAPAGACAAAVAYSRQRRSALAAPATDHRQGAAVLLRAALLPDPCAGGSGLLPALRQRQRHRAARAHRGV